MAALSRDRLSARSSAFRLALPTVPTAIAIALICFDVGAQSPGPVRSLELRTIPSDARVRPFDSIAGAFRGIANGVDMAKPFWGWHDDETREKRVLAKGQWGLDPAYAGFRNLVLPHPVSLSYIFNPYLQDSAEASAALV